MEGKEPIKISLKTGVIILLAVLVIIGIIAYIIYYQKHIKLTIEPVEPTNNSKGYEEVEIRGTTYYKRVGNSIWLGEHHMQLFETEEELNIMEVVSYKEYIELLKSVNTLNNEELEAFYSAEDKNYIILAYSTGNSNCELELIDIIEEDDLITIYGDEDVDGVLPYGDGYFIAIPTDKKVGTKIDYRECYSKSEIKNLKKYNFTYDPNNPTCDKPIIYLYPEEDTLLSVKLLKEENLTCSYPKYENEWNVIAKPNGDLVDVKTGRNLYSLYYECKNEMNTEVTNEGFVVKGEDTIKFLEEKLAILGLNEREAEEFILYWLPKLEANKYNYIRFASLEEINENMPLEISEEPDSLIRVLMIFKGLDEPIEVQEQKLETPSREGFVAVEWGGTEVK